MKCLEKSHKRSNAHASTFSNVSPCFSPLLKSPAQDQIRNIVGSTTIQTKLKAGSPDSASEREADYIAKTVVNNPKKQIYRTTEQEEEMLIQTKGLPDSGMAVSPEIGKAILRKQGSGHQLDWQTQSRMENALGADFSNVNVHRDNESDALNQQLGARAFTSGKDIFFRHGEYRPGSVKGDELIAHELVHVGQQTKYKNGPLIQASLLESKEDIDTSDAIENKSKDSLPEEMETTEEEESYEKEKPRWTDNTIKKDANARDEANRKESSIRRILKIKGDKAYLRKPDNFEPIHITDPRTIIQKRIWLVKAKKGGFRLAIEKGTEVIQLGDPKVHNTVKYYQVKWGNESGWIRESDMYLVWDLTYATRFRAKENLGLEFKVPKKTRLRFEDDGKLIAGEVHKKGAKKHDPTNLEKKLPDKLQKDTPCLILENRQHYYRVLDYAGLWDAGAEPPGWWTKSKNIKIVSAKINIDKITSDKVRNYVKDLKENQPERTAAETAISVSEISKTGKLIGHVAGGAPIFDKMGKRTKGKLHKGVYLVLPEEKSVPQKKGRAKIKLFKVVKLDDTTGTEHWTRSKDIKFERFERGYSVLPKNGQLVFVTQTKPAEARGQEPKADEYPVAPIVAKKLEESYFKRVEQLIATKKYSDAQEDLLYYARTFARKLRHDETKHPKPANLKPHKSNPLVIDKSAISQEGDNLTLNTDLIERIQRFCEFLWHTNLIARIPPKGSIYGIRSRTRAHELSTKWTLNPKSGHLKTHKQRLEFARRLVSLKGMPDASEIDWLWPGGIVLLRECLRVIDAPGTFYQSWLFPLITKLSIEKILSLAMSSPNTNVLDTLGVDTTSGEPGQKQTSGEENLLSDSLINNVRKLIDELVKFSQSLVVYVGNKRIQKAQAAEGFPRSEKWERRRPNTNDRTGVSNHCGGEAIDITFPFFFNYYDPIIDAIALYFGLYRPVKDSRGSPEHWHYERVGTSLAERSEIESMRPGDQSNPETHSG